MGYLAPMEEGFGKYLRLFGSIFFLVIGAILSLVLLLLGIKLIFGLLSYIPWITYVYIVFITLIPPVLFITIYTIYMRRTKHHPNVPVRWLSYLLLSAALIAWLIFLVMDIMILVKHAYTSVGMYHSYDMIFLITNVALIFLIGVMQALTTAKEKDWMERSNN